MAASRCSHEKMLHYAKCPYFQIPNGGYKCARRHNIESHSCIYNTWKSLILKKSRNYLLHLQHIIYYLKPPFPYEFVKNVEEVPLPVLTRVFLHMLGGLRSPSF